QTQLDGFLVTITNLFKNLPVRKLNNKSHHENQRLWDVSKAFALKFSSIDLEISIDSQKSFYQSTKNLLQRVSVVLKVPISDLRIEPFQYLEYSGNAIFGK